MRKFLIAISKRYPLMRALRYHYFVGRNRALSGLQQIGRPIRKNVVVFQAYGGRYTCSPKALYESMLHDEYFSDYKFIWVVSDKSKYKELAEQPRTTLVKIRTREYYTAFAESQYWVVNIMLPLRIVKRKGQTMVQCWHGTPLKRLRSDIIEDTKNVMNSRQDFIRKNLIDTRRYDYFISPSRFATEKFVSAFGIEKMQKEDRILEIGYPRNDSLHQANPRSVLKLKQRLGLPPGKKILLYAPTWRDDQHDSRMGYTYKNELDFEKLRRAIGDQYVVLFRAHYLIASSFNFAKYKGFVYNVSELDDINDLCLVSDVLITDYSSVMFDYANLQKPMIFFMYDYEHYEQNLRGFYLDINELPGEIVASQDRLVTVLQQLEAYEETHQKAYAAFANRYTYLDDGKAAKRLQAALFKPRLLPQEHRYSSPLHSHHSITNQGTK